MNTITGTSFWKGITKKDSWKFHCIKRFLVGPLIYKREREKKRSGKKEEEQEGGEKAYSM